MSECEICGCEIGYHGPYDGHTPGGTDCLEYQVEQLRGAIWSVWKRIDTQTLYEAIDEAIIDGPNDELTIDAKLDAEKYRDAVEFFRQVAEAETEEQVDSFG